MQLINFELEMESIFSSIDIKIYFKKLIIKEARYIMTRDSLCLMDFQF